jgi:hypothetical protein
VRARRVRDANADVRKDGPADAAASAKAAWTIVGVEVGVLPNVWSD